MISVVDFSRLSQEMCSPNILPSLRSFQIDDKYSSQWIHGLINTYQGCTSKTMCHLILADRGQQALSSVLQCNRSTNENAHIATFVVSDSYTIKSAGKLSRIIPRHQREKLGLVTVY